MKNGRKDIILPNTKQLYMGSLLSCDVSRKSGTFRKYRQHGSKRQASNKTLLQKDEERRITLSVIFHQNQ